MSTATETVKKMDHHDRAFQQAVAAGCQPFWHDGILGWAWHCGCPDEGPTHFIDQQCSVVKFYKK